MSTTGHDAESVAVATVVAFVNHDRGQDEWWADFSQYLSPEAAYVWEGVRADRVTASSITGTAIVSAAGENAVSVLVPTDIGQYRLDMVKRVEQHISEGVWMVFAMIARCRSEGRSHGCCRVRSRGTCSAAGTGTHRHRQLRFQLIPRRDVDRWGAVYPGGGVGR